MGVFTPKVYEILSDICPFESLYLRSTEALQDLLSSLANTWYVQGHGWAKPLHQVFHRGGAGSRVRSPSLKENDRSNFRSPRCRSLIFLAHSSVVARRSRATRRC